MASLPVKRNYRCVPSLQQFYSGGPFVVSSDGSFIACACGESIKIVDSSNASIRSTIDGDSEAVTALALSPDDRLLFSASHSRQIRVWDLSTFKSVRSWKVPLPLLAFKFCFFFFFNFFPPLLTQLNSLHLVYVFFSRVEI